MKITQENDEKMSPRSKWRESATQEDDKINQLLKRSR
jgi:hypothetical protein